VGAHFGLTPKKYQSGETDVTGGISKVGDAMVRSVLYEAANVMPIFDSWESPVAVKAADFLGWKMAQAGNVVPRLS
jgi:transposase